MNELSSYFAHHPLEDPANYLGTDFDPAGAAAYRLRLRHWRESRHAHQRSAVGPPTPGAAGAGSQRGPQRPPQAHCRYSFNLL